MTPAQRWSSELRKAMRVRGVTRWRLQERLSAGHGTVDRWHEGISLPSYEMALAASEVLDWQRLRSLIEELRTRTCGVCERTFVTKKALDANWCSPRCRSRRYWVKSNARKSAKNRERVGRLLALWEEVGDRMCRQWCPGGREDRLCPDATCPIQEAGFSPWPVSDGRLERVA